MIFRRFILLTIVALALAPGARAQEEGSTEGHASAQESAALHSESDDARDHEAGPFKRRRIAFLTGRSGWSTRSRCRATGTSQLAGRTTTSKSTIPSAWVCPSESASASRGRWGRE